VELPELVTWVVRALQRNPVGVTLVGTAADSVRGEGWALILVVNSDSVSVPAASRLDGPPAGLMADEPGTVLGGMVVEKDV